jgi:hypothetical protein
MIYTTLNLFLHLIFKADASDVLFKEGSQSINYEPNIIKYSNCRLNYLQY